MHAAKFLIIQRVYSTENHKQKINIWKLIAYALLKPHVFGVSYSSLSVTFDHVSSKVYESESCFYVVSLIFTACSTPC